jgi:hypothetical protein
MKKPYILLAGGYVLISLMSCTSLKRFKSATYMEQDHTLVELDLFSTQLIQGDAGLSGGTLWDLSAGAQTQFVQILDRRYPDNGSFTDALGQQYPESWTFPIDDQIEKKLRMVFTVRKKRDYTHLSKPAGRFSPADRIEFISFSLTLPDSCRLRFTQWNRFATEYGEIEIGDITFSRNLTFEVDGSLDPADFNPRFNLSRNEKQVVRSRYLKLNGILDEQSIEIREEGTREVDLTGNVLADVTLRFEGFPERITLPLFETRDVEGSLNTELGALVFKEVLVPRMEDAPDTIHARLQVEYIYRHVQSGWKTYQEWDDKVEYYSGKMEKVVPLFTRRDYVPDFFCLGLEVPEKKIVTIKSSHGREYPLQFANYHDASRVLEWILARSGQDTIEVSRHTLMFGGIPLTGDEIPMLEQFKVMPVY